MLPIVVEWQKAKDSIATFRHITHHKNYEEYKEFLGKGRRHT